MSIGDVFAKAWELWRRDIGWLILAGLLVGLIMVIILAASLAIFGAIFAGAGLTFGVNMTSSDSGALSAVGAGMLVVALIVYIVAMFLFEVVAMVFYGGMFEMVIGASRGNRGVELGDLFSGFRKFGAYTVFALVLFGINIGITVLNIIPVIGGLIGLAINIWIFVIWLYVLPLIADRGLSFGDAAKRSNEMVRGVGWWRTFGMVVVLGVAIAVAALAILFIAIGVARSSEGAGIALGFILFLVFAVLVPPYFICYISTMYLGSAGEAVQAPAGGYGVPAPPAYGAAPYVTPPVGGMTYQPAAPPPIAPAVGQGAVTAATVIPVGAAAPTADADAWRAAADPLAAQPPAPPAPTSPPAPPPVASHEHAASATPTVDGASGRLEKHCSACGALIEGSDEFCQACALEVSGGEPPDEPPAVEPAAEGPAAPEAPAAPEEPKT